MNIQEIGIAVSVPRGYRQLARLEEALGIVYDLGYRLVEFGMTPFPLIVNGEVRTQQVDDLCIVLRNFKLRYTLHGYNRLNLAYDARHDLCKQIMRCQIKVAHQIGTHLLVYHSGLQALDALRYGVRRTPFSEYELLTGAEQEVAAFRELAPIAADAGVIIGMENGDSHQWEHNLIAQFGLPRQALLMHHARLQTAPIVRQLEQIDHPNVGITLDVGHLYIAANDLGFDYLSAVSEAAPWVKHLHISDNFGKLDHGFDSEPERWAFGEADVHLPPGWGSVPYPEVFARLPNYKGDMILEIESGFADVLGESLTSMQNLISA